MHFRRLQDFSDGDHAKEAGVPHYCLADIPPLPLE